MVDTPQVLQGGLVTVAFLKAQLDAESDHIGMFMPLVLNVVKSLPNSRFNTSAVQDAIVDEHKIALPPMAVNTILHRAARKGYLRRDAGMFVRTNKFPSTADVGPSKLTIEEGQRALSESLVEHCRKNGIEVAPKEALDLLLKFLESEHVALLLSQPLSGNSADGMKTQQRVAVAQFCQFVLLNDNPLANVLKAILEGLVLYYAAFLPGLDSKNRRFNDLTAFFDSDLVRRTLGFEGPAAQAVTREIVRILVAEGVRCNVFDKTVEEIDRILEFYERNIGSYEGRLRLPTGAMGRHFLQSRYSIGDVRMMRASLQQSVEAESFRVVSTPARIPNYVGSEEKLQRRLADPTTKDEGAPRVGHDVDCVAAVLTIRKGRTSLNIEDSRALFVSASKRVIDNVTAWYREDDEGAGIPPMVHIQMLSNIAWLKKPKLCQSLLQHELIALCASVLKPGQETWNRFLKHLRKLEQEKKMTADEATMILISRLSDQFLSDKEATLGDDVDAESLDEVVERVQADMDRKHHAELEAAETRMIAAIQRADDAEQRLTEREARIAQRANAWARPIAVTIYWVLVALVVVAAILAIREHPFSASWPGMVLLVAVGAFVALESVGAIGHAARLREWLYARAASGLERVLRAVVAT